MHLVNSSFFQKIQTVPPDPILGLTTAFKTDPRTEKVNLGVGAYCTAEGKPYLLESVQRAEKIIFEKKLNKEYQPIIGSKPFLSLTRALILDDSYNDRIIGAQTIGGTGALRLGGDFLNRHIGKKIYLPSPTWPNHQAIFTQAGMEIDLYPYYNEESCGLNFSAMCAAIEKFDAGSIILFHTCCHNPTGADPTKEQWEILSQLVKERKLFPIFDNAYQGFSHSLEEDPYPIQLFAKQGHELMCALSFSKNLGLYGERIGALFFLLNEKSLTGAAESQLKVLIRRNYSSPPLHSSRIVTEILQSTELTKEWHRELSNMKGRIEEMRSQFASGLLNKGITANAQVYTKQTGMFSLTGLTKEQVSHLTKEHAIYLPKSSRINFAGLNSQNLNTVIDAYAAVQ